MKIVDIKIDRSSLPKDDSKIEWQTQNDFDNEVWQKGMFCDGDDNFLVGFTESHSNWSLVWEVLHWRYI